MERGELPPNICPACLRVIGQDAPDCERVAGEHRNDNLHDTMAEIEEGMRNVEMLAEVRPEAVATSADQTEREGVGESPSIEALEKKLVSAQFIIDAVKKLVPQVTDPEFRTNAAETHMAFTRLREKFIERHQQGQQLNKAEIDALGKEVDSVVDRVKSMVNQLQGASK